jgi:hypothetical protein
MSPSRQKLQCRPCPCLCDLDKIRAVQRLHPAKVGALVLCLQVRALVQQEGDDAGRHLWSLDGSRHVQRGRLLSVLHIGKLQARPGSRHSAA